MPKFNMSGKTYPSKGMTRAEIKRILNAWPIGQPITGADLQILLDGPIKRHPHAAEKIGGGVARVEVRLNITPGNSSRGFWIIRHDNSEIDFGAYMMFESKETLDKLSLNDATRRAVYEDVMRCKNLHFNGKDFARCSITGRTIHWTEAHVHHDGAWPFSRILTDWLATLVEKPQLIDRGLYSELARQQAQNFRTFHNERAKLVVICREENLRLGNKGNNK